MTAPLDRSSDEDIRAFHRGLLADLSAAVGDEQAITLTVPLLEYCGLPAAGPEFAMMHWSVDISMEIGDVEGWDEKRLDVGFLELWTVPVDGSLADCLDAISADTAEYLALVSHGVISDDVEEQFENPFMTGLLIINRAYIHPALRGRDLGAWAVAQAIRNLTFGSSEVLVVAYPTPTEDRPGVSEEAAAKGLAQHWGKAGLEPIEACPKLVGQATSADALDDARDALTDVADVEITVTVSDLIASTGQAQGVPPKQPDVPIPAGVASVDDWRPMPARSGWFRWLLDTDGSLMGVQMVESDGRVSSDYHPPR
jgi:hypothetical protein